MGNVITAHRGGDLHRIDVLSASVREGEEKLVVLDERLDAFHVHRQAARAFLKGANYANEQLLKSRFQEQLSQISQFVATNRTKIMLCSCAMMSLTSCFSSQSNSRRSAAISSDSSAWAIVVHRRAAGRGRTPRRRGGRDCSVSCGNI